MEEELTNFLKTNIPSHSEDECKDCERIVTAPSLQTELSLGDDPIEDMEQYIHTILNDDDPDIIECKDKYNEALIHNKEVQTLHNTLEDKIKIDKARLEEMKKNYNPKSEHIFNSKWDLSDSHEDDTIIKNLYEDLSNLNIQTTQKTKTILQIKQSKKT